MEATGTAVALEKTKPEPKRKGAKRNRKGGGCVYQPKFETKKDKALNAAASAAWRALGADPKTKPKKIKSRLGGWRIKYTWQHRSYDEKADVETKSAAQEILKQRFAEMKNGQFIKGSDAEMLRYEDMRGYLLSYYGRKGFKTLKVRKGGEPYIDHLKHLDEFFSGRHALDIDADMLDKFVQERQREGAQNGTINRALGLLRRMFHLAVERKKIRNEHIPIFPMRVEADPRKGFLECMAFPELRQSLPEYLRLILTLDFHTGMRKSEICTLRWENVDLLGGVLLLEKTKNGDKRNIALNDEILEMLKIARVRYPGCPWIFTLNGRTPIKSFRKAWNSACVRAGLGSFTCRTCGAKLDAKLRCASCQKRCDPPLYVGLLFHDLRRSGARNLVRAGVPESVAMKITGHRTRAVFERYNITSDSDLQEASLSVTSYVDARIISERLAKEKAEKASENDAPKAIVQ